MPDDNSDVYSLKTEITSTTKVLIIDEIGEFVSSLVDSLLSRGFDVVYFGACSTSQFDYLSQKSNFNYLNELTDETKLAKVDYIYFFPKENLNKFKQAVYLKNLYSSKLIIGTDIGFNQFSELEEFLESKDLSLKLIFYNQVFGPRVIKSEISTIILKSCFEEKVIINHSANEIIAPISAESLINEILRISFFPYGRGNCFFVTSEKITYGELAEKLKNIFPIKIFEFKDITGTSQNSAIFTKAKEVTVKENILVKIEETVDWLERNKESVFYKDQNQAKTAPKFSTVIINEMFSKKLEPSYFESHITKEEKNKRNEEKISEVDEKKETSTVEKYWDENNKNGVNFKKIFGYFLLFTTTLVVFFVIPILMTIIYGIKGLDKIQLVKTQLENGQYDQVLETTTKAAQYFQISQKTISFVEPFLSLVGLDKNIQLLNETLTYSQQINESIRTFSSPFGKVSESGQKLLNEATVDWGLVQGQIKTNFSYAYQQASLAQSSAKKAEKGFLLFKKNDLFDSLTKYLSDFRGKLLKIQDLSSILPEIFGVGGRKKYLVLFQNNLELRPTGGFISAIGIISFENGRLVNFEVYDIYKIDSLLKGQIEPPQKIKDLLGEQIWYFRDSNLDPDFSISAKNALWFLDKELHLSVEGVIGVNFKTLSEFLKITGGLNLPDYQDEITSENLLAKVVQYSDFSKINESVGKEEFAVNLVKTIFEKFKTLNSNQTLGLVKTIFDQLEKKEILIYFTDQKLETQIAGLGWDGNLRQFQKQVEGYSIFNDYLFINEANMGVNKANYFLNRKTEHEIKISDKGTVQEKLSLTYENQSVSDSWPAGTYKNYLRVYVPKDTQLMSVLITNPQNSDVWTPFNPQNIEVNSELDKTVFSFVFEVPTKSKVKLEVNYELNDQINLSRKINSYLLMVQKQSGSYSNNYQLIIDFPQNLIPLRVIPKAIVGGNTLLINEEIDRDRIFQIDLAN